MGKVLPGKWKPVDDSSPGYRTVDPGRMVLRVVEVFNANTGARRFGCPCGCGEVPRGEKAVFLMGHDARLRGKLIRAHLTDTEILYIVQGQHMPTLTAMKVAERHGKSFTEALKNAEVRREGKNRQVLRKAIGSHRLVRVGRWAYTGQVVAVYSTPGGDQYEVEYVDKLGEVGRTKVPVDEAPEQTTMKGSN